jgi:hypothetical protein
VRTVACSGATTKAIAAGQGGHSPQVDAVSSSVDLVMLTIGGNDAKFAEIVKKCLVAVSRDGVDCNRLLEDAEAAIADGGSIETSVRNALTAIVGRLGPRSELVLLGYPLLEGDPNYRLRQGHGGHTFVSAGRRIRSLGERADRLEARIVNELNAGAGAGRLRFESVIDLFAGPPTHELFAHKTNPDRWFVQPFLDAGLTARSVFYHPNRTGWRHESRMLMRDSWILHAPQTDRSPTRQGVTRPLTIVPDHDYLLAVGQPYPIDRIAGADVGHLTGTPDGVKVNLGDALPLPVPVAGSRAACLKRNWADPSVRGVGALIPWAELDRGRQWCVQTVFSGLWVSLLTVSAPPVAGVVTFDATTWGCAAAPFESSICGNYQQ